MIKLDNKLLSKLGKSSSYNRHNEEYRKYSFLDKGTLASTGYVYENSKETLSAVNSIKDYSRHIKNRITEELEAARWEQPLLPQFMGVSTITSTWKETTGSDYAKDIDIPMTPILGTATTNHNNSGAWDVANAEMDQKDFTDGFDTVRSRKMASGLDAYGYHTPEAYWYIDRLRVTLAAETRDAIHVGHNFKLVLSAGAFKEISGGYDTAYTNWGLTQGTTYDTALHEPNIKNGSAHSNAYFKVLNTTLTNWNARYIIMSDGIHTVKFTFTNSDALITSSYQSTGDGYWSISVGLAGQSTAAGILGKLQDGFDLARTLGAKSVNLDLNTISTDKCTITCGFAGISGNQPIYTNLAATTAKFYLEASCTNALTSPLMIGGKNADPDNSSNHFGTTFEEGATSEVKTAGITYRWDDHAGGGTVRQYNASWFNSPTNVAGYPAYSTHENPEIHNVPADVGVFWSLPIWASKPFQFPTFAADEARSTLTWSIPVKMVFVNQGTPIHLSLQAQTKETDCKEGTVTSEATEIKSMVQMYGGPR